MLPIELVNHITVFLDTHKQMTSFLSISKHFNTCKLYVNWNKGFVTVARDDVELPYYDNISKVNIGTASWFSKFPKYVNKICFINSLDSYSLISPLFMQNIPYLRKLEVYTNETINLNFLLRRYYYIRELKLLQINPKLYQFVNWNLVPDLETLYLNSAVDLDRNFLPKNLKKLVLFCFIGIIKSLPPFLEELEIQHNYDQYLTFDILPPTLKKLSLGKDYEKGINVGILPEGLQEINFGKEFNQFILYGSIPSTVRKITFGDRFNRCINTLPEGIEIIKVGLDFDHTYLLQQDIPSTLKEVYVPSYKEEFIKKCSHFNIIGYKHKKYKPPIVEEPSLWQSITNFFSTIFF